MRAICVPSARSIVLPTSSIRPLLLQARDDNGNAGRCSNTVGLRSNPKGCHWDGLPVRRRAPVGVAVGSTAGAFAKHGATLGAAGQAAGTYFCSHPFPRPMPNARHGWGRGSHDTDRVSVRHRLRIAPASRSLRTFSGMWSRSCPGRARSRAGNHPGIHPQLIAWCFGKKVSTTLEVATCAGTFGEAIHLRKSREYDAEWDATTMPRVLSEVEPSLRRQRKPDTLESEAVLDRCTCPSGLNYCRCLGRLAARSMSRRRHAAAHSFLVM